jgi:hypothetical protein
MGVQLGSQVISAIFSDATPPPNVITTQSGSAIGLVSSSYSNGTRWASSTGSAAYVQNSPLVGQAVNGRWQFNGSNDYIQIPTASLTASGIPNDALTRPPFTFLFYGTVNVGADNNGRRALLGASPGGYANGGDIILRRDTSPGTGKIHLDTRGITAAFGTGAVNRFTISGTSGSLLNLAVVQGNDGTQSVYQDGVLVAASGGLVNTVGVPAFPQYNPFAAGGTGTETAFGPYIGFNANVDASSYNGQLGAVYVYGRALTATEVSQSALSFFSGSNPPAVKAVNRAFIGNNLVYQAITPPPPEPPPSGAIIAIDRFGWTNTGSIWNNASGGISVINAPLVGTASNGFWQFNGTNDFITASRELISGSGAFDQRAPQNQDWTVLFYGTIGSIATSRALMGNPVYNNQLDAAFSGSDIIIRSDAPAGLPSNKMNVQIRTGRALEDKGSQFYDLTGSYVSGGIQNMAIVWNNPTASLYQDGVLVSSFANAAWNGPTIFFNSGSGTDGQPFDTRIFSNTNVNSSNFNGTLGAFYAYNRALTPTEISQSAQYFAPF